MATMKEKSTALTLKVATGTDESGKTIFANRTIGNINPDISDENFCVVATGLSGLQSHTLASVNRVNTSTFELD